MSPDLYTELLDIPEGPRPPDCYTLLGLPLYENGPEAIRKAVLSQTAKVRRHALDPDQERAQRIQEILNEIGRARTILGDPQRKSRHDDLMIARQFGFEVPPESSGTDDARRHKLCPDCGARMVRAKKMCTRCGWEQQEAGRRQTGTPLDLAERDAPEKETPTSWFKTVFIRVAHRAILRKARLRIPTIRTALLRRIAIIAVALGLAALSVVVLAKLSAAERARLAQREQRFEQALANAREAVEREDWVAAASSLSAARTSGWHHTAKMLKLERNVQEAQDRMARRQAYEKALTATREALRRKDWPEAEACISAARDSGWHDLAGLRPLEEEARSNLARQREGKRILATAEAHRKAGEWDLAMIAVWQAIATGWHPAERARALRTEAESQVCKLGNEIAIMLGGGVEMRFCWIPATRSKEWMAIAKGENSFLMGSPSSEIGRETDESQHRVLLSKGFWLGKYEVTQKQWRQIMGSDPRGQRIASSNSSRRKPTDRPVVYVTAEDAAKLNEKLNRLGFGRLFRLPTEAEWEYACRAGSVTALSNGRQLTQKEGNSPALDQIGWYSGNSGDSTHPVGQKKPNPWGLCDMHGNVWEWCQDWHGPYPSGSVSDPKGSSNKFWRVIRGGSWRTPARCCRSAHRARENPSAEGRDRGLRVILTCP